jgi:hypothetical protein
VSTSSPNGHVCGDGGERRLLEDVLLPPRRPARGRGDAGQRPAREDGPGRKTDVADATWLAQLGAHGLVRAPFVPPEPIRQLRDLTRVRTAITRERAREAQRMEKLLEDAGIKLSAVASDILGVSGRAMLEALNAGDDNPAALADLAKRRLRNKIPETTQTLNGRFNATHSSPRCIWTSSTGTRSRSRADRADRADDGAPSGIPRPDLHHLRDQHPDRGRARGRDRRGHEQVPHPPSTWRHGPAPRREQRVRRQEEVEPDPARQPVPPRRARRSRDGVRATSRHLPQRQVPAHRCPPRPAEGQRPPSGTRCSSRSGTWAAPASSTTTPAPPTTPGSTPSAPGREPSTNSKRWATASTLDAS